MLAFLTTCPFYDWGENWPAGFQEENVNHGLAGLMTPCLSLMLISVNWALLEGFGKRRGAVLHISNTRAGALVRWRRLSVCSSLVVRDDLFSPQWIPFTGLDLHSYSRGQLFFGGGGRELWCPPFQIQIWAKMPKFAYSILNGSGSNKLFVWLWLLHCRTSRTRTGFLSVKWGPNLVDFFFGGG